MNTFQAKKCLSPGNTKEGSITVPLTSCLPGLESAVTTDNFCFYLQNRLIQTSQKGDQQYSDTSPFSIPCYLTLGIFTQQWRSCYSTVTLSKTIKQLNKIHNEKCDIQQNSFYLG